MPILYSIIRIAGGHVKAPIYIKETNNFGADRSWAKYNIVMSFYSEP